MNQEELSDVITTYQVKYHVNDTELAFVSHLSVEKIHAMKTGDGSFTGEETNQILEYIQSQD